MIATPKKTLVTKERHPDAGWHISFIGQETTFAVQTALKGKIAGNEIRVLHYWLPKGVRVADGPLLVSFRAEPMRVKGIVNGVAFQAQLGQPDYMLFLRRRPDGRYEPLSGQIDPALSVRELRQPDDVFPERDSE